MKSDLLLLLICLVAFAFACGPDRPPTPFDGGNGRRPRPRTLSCYTIENKQGLFCDAVDQESTIRFDFETLGFPRFRAFFFNKTSNISPNARMSQAVASYRIGFFNFFEYQDNVTAPDGYQNEPRLHEYLFWGDGRAWSPINLTGPVIDANNISSYTFSTTFAFPKRLFRFLPSHGDNFTCTLVGHISDQFMQTPNFTTAPNSFKFDINLNHIAYTAGYTNSTYALVALVEGEGAGVQGTSSSNRWVNIGDTGSFTWLDHVQTDVGDVPIIATTLQPLGSDESGLPAACGLTSTTDCDSDLDRGLLPQHKVVFTLNTTLQPTTVRWDPTLTSADSFTDTDSSTNPGTPSPSTAATANTVLWLFTLLLLVTALW